ncbi:MAG: hypothetical protein HY909_31635 [Deltaproteobacteria bacterium]|nr:hypothetical protein [Deltaproteobacteria bacterium]
MKTPEVSVAALDGVAEASRAHFGAGRLRVATAGYTVSLDREHPRRVAALLTALVAKASPEALGFVTSPTTRAGSIDRVTSEVALALGVPLLHVTAREFLGAARPNALRDPHLRARWEAVPRLVLPTREAYSQATAYASDALLVFSGRDASVSDFSFALERGNRAVLAVDAGLGALSRDPSTGRPVDAARFLKEALQCWSRGEEPPDPLPPTLSPERRARWGSAWQDRVLALSWGEPYEAHTRRLAAFLAG